MAEGAEGDRHSKAQIPDLITDPKARAEQEALNALIQFDHTTEAIRAFTVRPDRPFTELCPKVGDGAIRRRIWLS